MTPEDRKRIEQIEAMQKKRFDDLARFANKYVVGTQTLYDIDFLLSIVKGQEAQKGNSNMSFDGATIIEVERRRQLYAKSYTPEHDDSHTDQSLVKAAACYATPNRTAAQAVELWPWENPPIVNHNIHNFQGRKARIRELAKAGALIAAEIDRLARIKEPS